MGGSLWRETLGKRLGLHNAVDSVGGTSHGRGCRTEDTHFHVISCTKTGQSSLTHNRVLHHVVARPLRENNVQITIDDAWPFKQRGSIQYTRHNPRRMDVTTDAGAIFDNDLRHKSKALLLYLTIANPCVSSNLEGSLPATSSLLFLAMSTCRDLGPDVYA